MQEVVGPSENARVLSRQTFKSWILSEYYVKAGYIYVKCKELLLGFKPDPMSLYTCTCI